MRYVYFKNGDSVEQVQRVLSDAGAPVSSGPDAFIWDFLQSVSTAEVTVLSRNHRNAYIHLGNVEAQVFDKGKGPLTRLVLVPLVFLRVMKRIINAKPMRIICGATGSMLWACYLAARFLNVPIVYSGHNRLGLESERWYRRWSARIDRWCIRRAKAVICHGPYLREELHRMGADRRPVFEFDVGFGDMLIDADRPLVERYRPIVADRKVILFVGRLEKDKGVFDLLDACSERLNQDSRLQLLYAGVGSQMNQLNEEIHRRSLDGRVVLMGFVPHEDLAALMRRCWVMVTPTRGEFPEGRCMAAMEGQVMGLPVIAPDFGPFTYIVSHGMNGLLFETGSVKSLKQCISDLLADTQLYAQLLVGAEDAGRALVVPPLTFGAAVQKAFS